MPSEKTDSTADSTLGELLYALEVRVAELGKDTPLLHIASIVQSINAMTKDIPATENILTLPIQAENALTILKQIALLGTEQAYVSATEIDPQDEEAARWILTLQTETHRDVMEVLEEPAVTGGDLQRELRERISALRDTYDGWAPTAASIEAVAAEIEESILCALVQTNLLTVQTKIQTPADVDRLELVPRDVQEVRDLIGQLDRHLEPRLRMLKIPWQYVRSAEIADLAESKRAAAQRLKKNTPENGR